MFSSKCTRVCGLMKVRVCVCVWAWLCVCVCVGWAWIRWNWGFWPVAVCFSVGVLSTLPSAKSLPMPLWFYLLYNFLVNLIFLMCNSHQPHHANKGKCVWKKQAVFIEVQKTKQTNKGFLQLNVFVQIFFMNFTKFQQCIWMSLLPPNQCVWLAHWAGLYCNLQLTVG